MTALPPDSCETCQALDAGGLYRLMALLSPAFPVGAYTYSHGLEQVIEDGEIRSAADLCDYLAGILRYGSGLADAILLSSSHEAAMAGDVACVEEIRDLGLALAPSRERLLETAAQGTAFLGTCRKAWAPPMTTRGGRVFGELIPVGGELPPWPYPVAVGLTAAAWNIPVEPVRMAALQAFAGTLISAAVRLVPLGQTDGQRVLHQLEPVIFEVARTAAATPLEETGSAAFSADMASIRHETQYTRLFRS